MNEIGNGRGLHGSILVEFSVCCLLLACDFLKARSVYFFVSFREFILAYFMSSTHVKSESKSTIYTLLRHDATFDSRSLARSIYFSFSLCLSQPHTPSFFLTHTIFIYLAHTQPTKIYEKIKTRYDQNPNPNRIRIRIRIRVIKLLVRYLMRIIYKESEKYI